jgi:hypothetical protein
MANITYYFPDDDDPIFTGFVVSFPYPVRLTGERGAHGLPALDSTAGCGTCDGSGSSTHPTCPTLSAARPVRRSRLTVTESTKDIVLSDDAMPSRARAWEIATPPPGTPKPARQWSADRGRLVDMAGPGPSPTSRRRAPRRVTTTYRRSQNWRALPTSV